MDRFLTKGSFEPEELNSLKAIFDEVTSQDWFDQSVEAKEAFAKSLIETYPAGMYDARKHRMMVMTSARMFYSPSK